MFTNTNMDLFCGRTIGEFVLPAPIKTKQRTKESFIADFINFCRGKNIIRDRETFIQVQQGNVNTLINLFQFYFNSTKGFFGSFRNHSGHIRMEQFASTSKIEQFMDPNMKSLFNSHYGTLMECNGFVYFEGFMCRRSDDVIPIYTIFYLDQDNMPRYYIPICGNVLDPKFPIDFCETGGFKMEQLFDLVSDRPKFMDKIHNALFVKDEDIPDEFVDSYLHNPYAYLFWLILQTSTITGFDEGTHGAPPMSSDYEIENFKPDDLFYYLEWNFDLIQRDVYSHVLFV